MAQWKTMLTANIVIAVTLLLHRVIRTSARAWIRRRLTCTSANFVYLLKCYAVDIYQITLR